MMEASSLATDSDVGTPFMYENDCTACVTFDVCCQFGFIRNVDLCSRGFYYIQVNLSVGPLPIPSPTVALPILIAPVRCFSCPTSLATKVRDTQLPPAPLLHMCNIQDLEKTFQCRSFMIRYKVYGISFLY
jgi:hypothetical protein